MSTVMRSECKINVSGTVCRPLLTLFRMFNHVTLIRHTGVLCYGAVV